MSTTGQDIEDAIAEICGNIIATSSTLTCVNLNSMSSPFHSCLVANSQIDNRIGSSGMKAIGVALPKTTTLKTLLLKGQSMLSLPIG